MNSHLINGRYLLGRFLGAGAFGTTFEAEHRVLGHTLRRVALKLFTKEKLALPIDELLGDAIKLAGLVDNCPDPMVRDRFIQCFDAGEDDETHEPYVVLELITGGTVASRVRDGRLPVGEAQRYAREIAEGLDFMHESGLLHRDLHPGNLLLSKRRSIKIADFGLATVIDRVSKRAPAAGCIIYQAPEAMPPFGGDCDASADVYAVGLVLYELLAGTLPYSDEALVADVQASRSLLLQQKLAAPRRPSELNFELRSHPDFEDIVMTCLDPTPAGRYRDGHDLLTALSKLETGQKPSAPRADPWESIHSFLGQARAALERSDCETARSLLKRAEEINAELPSSNAVGAVYELSVDIAIKSQESVEDVCQIAQAGIDLLQRKATYRAMGKAMHYADLPQAKTFEALAREAPE